MQGLGDVEAAVKDFEKCLSLEANNAAAKKQLFACKEQIKKHQQREKQIYGGMFDKFARADANRAANALRAGVLKDGVGEWDDDEKRADSEAKDELSDVKLLSSGDDIKGEELKMS